MSIERSPDFAPRGNLFKATLVSLLVAGALLVTVVLPAEYGIDPTGVGAWLGLTVLSEPAAPEAPAPASVESARSVSAGNVDLASKAAGAFGASEKQSFAAEALTARAAGAAPRQESLTVTLAPGKGAEVKA